MQKLEQNSQHILLIVGFLNLPHIPPEALERVLQDFPEYENVLPAITSNRCAFNKLKDELNGYKTPVGRLITSRGKADELSKWDCFQEPIDDAFSILHAIANREGHDAEPDGLIALSTKGNVLVSTSAFLMCQKYKIDPISIFNANRGVVDALALRRAFVKFEKQLSVKGIKMNNGTLLVHPSLKDYVDGYIAVLRALGVSDKFVSSWNIFANADFNALKKAYEDHAVNHLKSLEEKLLANQNARESTFKNDQQELQSLLELLDEYQISDAFIKEFARLDKMLDDNIAKLASKQAKSKDKANKTKPKTSDAEGSFERSLISETITLNKACRVQLNGSYPKLLEVDSFSYNPKTKIFKYEAGGGVFVLDLPLYESLTASYLDTDLEGVNATKAEATLTILIADGEMIAIRGASREASTDATLAMSTAMEADEDSGNTEVFYQVDDEAEIMLANTRVSYPSDNATTDSFDEEELQEVEALPQQGLSNITLRDVQAWVLGRAMEGREAKYTDAVGLYGQAIVDQAISQNLVFNYKGFLEEA